MRNFSQRLLIKVGFLILLFTLGFISAKTNAAKPSVKAKFYDFSEHLIDGHVRKPQALYMDVRREAEFKRLLRIKRSFMKELFKTAKDPVFK